MKAKTWVILNSVVMALISIATIVTGMFYRAYIFTGPTPQQSLGSTLMIAAGLLTFMAWVLVCFIYKNPKWLMILYSSWVVLYGFLTYYGYVYGTSSSLDSSLDWNPTGYLELFIPAVLLVGVLFLGIKNAGRRK